MSAPANFGTVGEKLAANPQLRQKLNTLAGLYGERVTFNTRHHAMKGPDEEPLRHPTGYESLVEAGLIDAEIANEGQHDETVTYRFNDFSRELLGVKKAKE